MIIKIKQPPNITIQSITWSIISTDKPGIDGVPTDDKPVGTYTTNNSAAK